LPQEIYIKIPNQMYEPIIIDDVNTGTMFSRIGTIGFTIMSFLQIIQENKSSSRIRIGEIRNMISIAKNETIVKYLNAVWREDLIAIDSKTYGDKLKATEMLTYSINPNYMNAPQYEPINVELFNKKIKSIGSDGWSVLCYLTKMHNYSFGSTDSQGSIATTGYACPTLDQMRDIFDIGSKEKLTKILNILEDERLINILKATVVSSYVNSTGVEKYKRATNKYVVHNKIPNSAYYLSVNNTAYQSAMKNKLDNAGV
jgi:hypothetical protein